jgi:hypothetical protein
MRDDPRNRKTTERVGQPMRRGMLDGQRRRKTTVERRQLRVRECPRITMLRVRVRQCPDPALLRTTMPVRSPHRNLAPRRTRLLSEDKWRHVREPRIIIRERVVRRIM